jgi:PKD repeat protein
VRFPDSAGTYTGRPWSRLTPAEINGFRFVRQEACDGGVQVLRGQSYATGTTTCPYLMKWETNPANGPHVFSDLQIAIGKPWLSAAAAPTAVEGATDTASSGITIIPMALDMNPIGVPTASISEPVFTAPGTYTFTSTSTDSLNSFLTETWDFGDPTSATNTAQGTTVSHTYTKPGNYTVTLKVSNLAGRESTTTHQITLAAPTLSVSVDLLDGVVPPLDQDAPLGVQVTARASAEGLGDLTGLTFDQALLTAAPATAFTVIDGPTPAPAPAGFSLSPGGTAAFVMHLQPALVGNYNLHSKLTGKDAAGNDVVAEASSPGEIGAALQVELAIDPPFADQPEGPDGPEPVDATLTIKLTNTTAGPMTNVNLRSLRVDRTAAGQLLAVEQTGGVAPDPTDGFVVGTLAAGETRQLTATFRATDDAEVEFSALATGHTSDDQDVTGARKLRWSVKPKYLVSFSSNVFIPANGALLPAGNPITIRGTVKNLSTSAKLELGPLFPEVRGNAGVMTLTYNATGGVPGTLSVPAKLVLDPAESMEFNVKITTGWSDPRGTGDVARSGGTSTTATFTPWGWATLEDGTIVEIQPAQIKTTDADLSRRVSIDDSIPIPVTDPLALGGAILVGTVEGVGSAIAALLGGVVDLAKLPYTAIVATSAYQKQVWDSFTDSEKQDFVNDAGLMVAAVLARNAEFGKRDAAQLYETAKAVTLQSMTEMANDWEVGDYTKTAQMYTRFGSDAIAQVAVPIALAKMVKSPVAIAALKRAQDAIQLKMAPVFARAAQIEKIEELGPILDDLVNGAELTAEQSARLYGITEEEIVELQRLSSKYKFLLTVRSRHASSIEWIKRFGALLKPEVLKLKTVSDLDTRLGYRAEDLGSLVFKKPEAYAMWQQKGGLFGDHIVAYLEQRGFQAGTPDWEKAVNRIVQRTSEWKKFEKDYKYWSKRGFIDVSFNYKGNAIDDTIRKGTGQYRGFRLRSIGDEEYVIEMLDNKTGRFVPVTGDIDPIAFTHLDGSPLTAQEHAALLDDMRKSTILQAQHGESATFVKGGTEFIESQFKPGEPGMQIAPGGLAPRVVRFNREKSHWENPFDYHLRWEGGYSTATSTARPPTVPGPDLAAVGAAPEVVAAPTAPIALPGRPSDAGANLGRCRISYANTATAETLYMNDQGEIVELIDGQPVAWAEGPSCFTEGPIVEVAILPSTLVGSPTFAASAFTSARAEVAGDTHLPISTDPMYASIDPQAGFMIGQVITINPGTSTAETRTIVGFGSLVVDRPLAFDHLAGEPVVVVALPAPTSGQLPEQVPAPVPVPGRLPRTGGDVSIEVTLAVLPIVAGLMLVVIAARRRRTVKAAAGTRGPR